MNEYLIKFWTNDNRLSGIRIFAISVADAIQIAKTSYNAANVTSWEKVG